MEEQLLQLFGVFLGGVVIGVIIMLIINKFRSGSVSPGNLKQEYDEYQANVEAHFEETSKKFKNMTDQYQDLYKHLSVGATSLCRADSVAATLADQTGPLGQPAKLEKDSANVKPRESSATVDKKVGTKQVKGDVAAAKQASKPAATKPAVKPAAKSAAKPGDQTMAKPADKPAAKPVDKSAVKRAEPGKGK